jgi:signal peptidase II
MSIFKRLILIAFVLLACVGCDQSTKSLAEAQLPRTQRLSFFADTVRLQVAHNEGSFLSLGASAPKAWRNAALRIGVVAILLAVLAYALSFKAPRMSVILALALVFSGGLSNLIDRFMHDGYVVDFINLGLGPVRTGIFNVADIAITAGVLGLLIHGWRSRQGVA